MSLGHRMAQKSFSLAAFAISVLCCLAQMEIEMAKCA
jgi:hypothetical protein